MPTVADQSLITQAVLDVLETALSPALVGLGQIPTAPDGGDIHDLDNQAFFVLYTIPSGGRVFAPAGAAAAPETSRITRYQIDCVGIQWEAAEHGCIRALQALIDATWTVADHEVIWVRWAGDTAADTDSATVQRGVLVDIAFQATA